MTGRSRHASVPFLYLTFLLFLTLGVSTFQPSLLFAQAGNFTLEGKITKLSEGKFTVGTQDNIIFHVRYDDKTEFSREEGGAATAKDLRLGLYVKVVGDLTESGEIAAFKVAIQQPPEKEKPAPH